MYHPTRGGTRGGQAEFTWDQVRADQHRENYLGHSVLAPTGRWQNNKDVNWYNKDKDGLQDQDAIAEKRRKELMEVKMREEEEMNKRLGIKPGQGMPGAPPAVGDVLLRGSSQFASSSRAGTGSNRAPLDSSKSRWNTSKETTTNGNDAGDDGLTKEDRKAARKLAKMQVREERREEKRRRREEYGSKLRKDYSSDSEEEESSTRKPLHRPSRYNLKEQERDGNSRRDERESGQRDYHDHREGERRQHRDRDRGTERDEAREGRRSDHDTERRRRYERDEPRDLPRDQRHKDDRRIEREPYRKQDRSRSPGRSITPEMQRRRRE